MAEFELNTKSMAPVANTAEDLVNKMRDLKNDLEHVKNDLLITWAGYGRNEFEKQYRLLNQQFTDIIDDAWDMFEKIVASEESYIQADVNMAKTEAGVDNNF